MVNFILRLFGGLIAITSIFNISIKLFGSDDAVLRYAGSSRNMDTPILSLAIGIVFLGLATIIKKLDDLEERLDAREAK